MKTSVIVKSRTVTECSVPVIIQRIVHELSDGTIDERELSRSYVFRNFESVLPFETAKMLLEQRPGEFYIDSPVGGDASDEVKAEIAKLQEKSRGYTNPLTGFKASSRAGLMAHIRSKSKDEWKESGEDLDKFLEMYS